MRRALAWTLAAVGALLALVWLAFEPPPANRAPHPAARVFTVDASGDTATRDESANLASGSIRASDSSLELAEELALGRATRTPTHMDASAQSASTLDVHVTDSDGGAAAAAGAHVWLFAHSARGATFEPALRLEFTDLERRLAQADETRVCDGEGHARFRQRAGAAIAIARSSDGRIGWNVSAADASQPLEVELVRDFDVEVLVRDSDGQPAANVPVVLRRVLTVSSDYVEQRTDSAGRAKLQNAGALLSRPGGAWYAQVGFAATDVPAQRVTLRRPPSSPLEFTLPPRGSVELVLSGRDGAVAATDVRAMLRSTATSRPKPGLERWPTGSSTPLEPATNGRVLFEHVALGAQFEATLVHALFERTVTFAGPTRPGERVVVRFNDCGGATWTARVVDEQREPWRGELVARANEGSQVLGQRREVKLHPDSDGLVRIEAPQLPPLEDARVLTLVSLDRQGREAAAGRAQVRALSAIEDLGEIVLSPVEPLATGRVVDWRDQPVCGARVLLVDDSDADDPKPRLPFATHTDASGRFELQFALDESSVALHAIAEGRASQPLRVAAGARDLRLELTWGGEVLLELVQIPPGRESAVKLDFALTPSGAPFGDLHARQFVARSRRDPSARPQSSVRLDNVPAGVWDFVIAAELVGPGRRELARVQAVARLDEQHPSVDAGPFNVLALIEPIVVSASAPGSDERWFSFSLSSRGRGVDALADALAQWSFTRTTSSLLVPAALAPFDLAVHNPSCLEARFEAVRADVHAVLRPAPWIEIVLASDAAPLPEDQSYCAALAPLTRAPRSIDFLAFNAQEVCRLRAKSAGAMRIALGVCSTSRRPIRDVRELPHSDWPLIEVSELGPQRVVVNPSRAAVDTALAAPTETRRARTVLR